MKKHLVFCHGFGFDKNFWKNLAPYFLNEQCTYLDLGYFADNCTLNAENFCYPIKSNETLTIGIGHSLGLSKLLNTKQKFDYLIGLNSCVNFLGNEKDLRKKREVELALLTKHFMKSPINIMHNFYQRCGVAAEIGKIEKINSEVALNDLQFLAQSFNVPCDIPTLIIGACDDVIAPPAILYDNFAQYSNVVVQIMDHGMHGLGLLEADEISQRIKSFVYAAD
jgi:pimeloyl-[acyl-carrier protein] methyl ester esterase